ncbi:MAG: hypothetical protein ACRBFS_25760 [Aureispira sp.]
MPREGWQLTLYTYFLLELTDQGGKVYHGTEEGERKLQADYNWAERITVAVKQVPKSKEKKPPYYIQLGTLPKTFRLFNGQLPTNEISYAASLLEALLEQRDKGSISQNWIKNLKDLTIPVSVDWSEHLIDDE